MSAQEASIALRRFGLGPRGDDVKRVAADPRGYVVAALARKDAAVLAGPDLEPSRVAFQALREAQASVKASRDMVKSEAAVKVELGPAPAMATDGGPRPGRIRREVFREEAFARLDRATTTDQPFLERLVMFWSNHFAVSALKGGVVRIMAGAYERETIRPHVLGTFGRMLKAVEQHPAMLIYLDNAQSIGPNSPAGRNRGKGLNENLAREILELHTLGVDGGYSQADVTSLAKIITGWSVSQGRERPVATEPGSDGEAGTFAFFPRRHEPGPQTVLSRRYEDRGLATGEQALADIARHPATARHIARKLAAHFVSQSPPPDLVVRLEKSFRDTDGDLAALARTLASSPECWQVSPKKVVPPYDFAVSLIRAFDLKIKGPEVMRVAAAIGQPLWQVPSPKGWPDDDDAWMGPSAVRERLRIAERIARDIDRAADPRATADRLFGDAMSNEARLAVQRAETREQGFELLIMSPEFLRR